MVGRPGGDWVLIDAGMPGSGPTVLKVAEERFGKDNPPKCIALTHGHFDHVGGLTYLLEHWGVPVYAHINEFPYLNGSHAYPEPDPSVEGGLLAKIASIYPHEATNVASALHELPHHDRMPCFSEWSWISTPGHSPGHVAFYREDDGVLISGDAVITVRQDSLYNVLLQKEEVNGPPRYFTSDWDASRQSALTLAELNPSLMISGHGQFMEGEELRAGLQKLAAEFDEIARPAYGKYTD
ncbi:MBL fold metallo-hydrolase [Pedobacter faecalis]|uniref:MBL fold metallo-hydrolase n=1 Tax=Pedobacter faecalis TaxID=3041495 RepID=UPI0025514DA0|nr:MBL fold metallo-hydrolase [Pedobacter sp. ELA7]